MGALFPRGISVTPRIKTQPIRCPQPKEKEGRDLPARLSRGPETDEDRVIPSILSHFLVETRIQGAQGLLEKLAHSTPRDLSGGPPADPPPHLALLDGIHVAKNPGEKVKQSPCLVYAHCVTSSRSRFYRLRLHVLIHLIQTQTRRVVNLKARRSPECRRGQARLSRNGDAGGRCRHPA